MNIKNYKSALNIRETEVAIKDVKDYFQDNFAKNLNLTRVSAPLFVDKNTGLNDNLNGVERPVTFDIQEQEDIEYEIVHSLAKWKRQALKNYDFQPGEGLYTDMNAIRRDEVTDEIHSIYVDQWDWEKVITKEQRVMSVLKDNVKVVYKTLKSTEDYISSKYEYINSYLPNEITFVTTQELEDMYPNLIPDDRETEFAKKHIAICVTQIGDLLASGERHDGRAPDYDDWSLNADIVIYFPVLDIAMELSSMGIRVDEKILMEQLEKANCLDRIELPFQKALLNGELPYTIGGGIGQSRLCMFFLKKAHIGEVQSSVWTQETLDRMKELSINLL